MMFSDNESSDSNDANPWCHLCEIEIPAEEFLLHIKLHRKYCSSESEKSNNEFDVSEIETDEETFSNISHRKRSDYNNESSDNDDSSVRCHLCEIEFQTLKEFKLHIDQHLKGSNSKSDKLNNESVVSEIEKDEKIVSNICQTNGSDFNISSDNESSDNDSSVWCHLCEIKFPTFKEFEFHIEQHQKDSNSENDKLNNESVVSEIESNEKTVSNISQGNRSIHNISPDSESSDSNDSSVWCHLCETAIPTFKEFKLHVKQHRKDGNPENYVSETESDEETSLNIPQGNRSELSIALANKSDDSNAHVNESLWLFQSDSDCKSDDGIAFPAVRSPAEIKVEVSSAGIELEGNAVPIITSLARSNLDNETVALYRPVNKICEDSSMRKSKQCKSKKNKSNSDASASKRQKVSNLKKISQVEKKKVSFNFQKLPKHRLSASAFQENIPKYSDSDVTDNSKSSFNEDSNHANLPIALGNNSMISINNSTNSQLISDNHPVCRANVQNAFKNNVSTINNSLIPQPVFYTNPLSHANSQNVLNNFCNPIANNFLNSQSVSNNNLACLVYPYGMQNCNNSVPGNQAVQLPLFVLNTPAAILKPDPVKFVFDSKNILKWLAKFQDLCSNMPYPLPLSLFTEIQAAHKAIFHHYCTAPSSEESKAVLMVYEEFDCMIHKHINSINNELNVF